MSAPWTPPAGVDRAELDRLVREAIDRSELATRVSRLEAQLQGNRVVQGFVSSAGATSGDTTKFTVTKGAAGLYTFAWTPAFTETPSLVLTPFTAARIIACVDTGVAASGSGCGVFLFNEGTVALTDTGFFFIATGGI